MYAAWFVPVFHSCIIFTVTERMKLTNKTQLRSLSLRQSIYKQRSDDVFTRLAQHQLKLK